MRTMKYCQHCSYVSEIVSCSCRKYIQNVYGHVVVCEFVITDKKGSSREKQNVTIYKSTRKRNIYINL